MKTYLRQKLFLLPIILLAIVFRFTGVNWDQGQHLHPDERFLTMVGNAMHVPASFSQYLNPHLSPMNPANINFSFYVYGVFPVTLNKMLSVLLNADNYHDFTLLGRMLSAGMDVLAVLLVYKIVALLEKKHTLIDPSVKYLAAFFYAVAVLPIQLAHFFAVDTFLNTFSLAACYFSLAFLTKKQLYYLVASGIFFGLALATKINAVFIMPVLLIYIAGESLFEIKRSHSKRALLTAALYAGLHLIFFGSIAYLILRLTDPYIFEYSNILNPLPSKLFLQNIRSLSGWNNVNFPPAVQWVHKPPVLFALSNLAIFGVGLPYFLCVVLGIYVVIKTKSKPLLVILGWILIFFLYQSTQFVKAMRYFIMIYPFLAIFAAFGFSYFLHKKHLGFWIVGLLLILIWPLMYLSIYLQPHSRVTASAWIYKQLPENSALLNEYWDDPLPLPLPSQYRHFNGDMASVFDPDVSEKWKKLRMQFDTADYYILSSNRAWGSIPTVPEHYPLMTKFYRDLLKGKTAYKKVAEFSSYPSLAYLGIPLTLPDQWAEESFTVYDHPKVMIFKNTAR